MIVLEKSKEDLTPISNIAKFKLAVSDTPPCKSKNMKIKKITFVEFELGTKHFLSATLMPRSFGLVLIASIVKQQGYDVKVYCDHISPVDMERVKESDLICCSPLTASSNKVFAFADYVRNNWDIPLVVGGTFATYFTDLCLEHFDYVIRNEGDETILELIRCIEQGQGFENVKGLSFRSPSGGITHNEKSPQVEDLYYNQDLSLIEGYSRYSNFWLMLLKRKIRWIVLQGSRGCPFACDYCIAPVMYGKGHRSRTIASVIDDINTKKKYGDYFLFMDNCFSANISHTKELLRQMISEKLGGRYIAFIRYESAEDEELLELMKRAGFIQLYIGAESLNDEVFVRMKKHMTVQKLIRSIQLIQKHKLAVTLSFQAGNDEDDRHAVRNAVDFGIEYDLNGVYFISTWSFPEAPKPVFAKNRMILKSLDYGSGHYVTHFPLNVKPSSLQKTILEQQKRFWSIKRGLGFLRQGKWERFTSLLIQHYALSLFEKQVDEYVDYLEEIEEGYYDANETLDLARIASRNVDYKGEYAENYQDKLIGNFLQSNDQLDQYAGRRKTALRN